MELRKMFLFDKNLDKKILLAISLLVLLILPSPTKSSSILCSACRNTFSLLQNSDYKIQINFLEFFATELCVLEKMYDREVCKGGVKEMVPPIIEAYKARLFNPDLACYRLRLCPQVFKDLDLDELAKDILKDKPKTIEFDGDKKKLKNNSKKENIILKVLHISDLHTDVEYKEGTDANCSYPVCCNKKPRKGSEALKAGKWGCLANCDLPHKTVEQFVKFVNKNFQIDFALWTGDNTSHDIWHQTTETNLENSKILTNLFKSSFNFTFFPVIGNHESFPVNVYDFLSEREKGFDSTLAEIWRDWIGEEAYESFKKNAYYSIFNSELNLKIIGLNSQACNSLNWYLFKDPTDPGNMLKWLREELYKSESSNHKVYIISHYPPNTCLNSWAKIYNAIIDRFSHIIKAQFSGHTHGDNFQVHRDSFTNKFNNVVFMPASLTTYSRRNPSFRIYHIDSESLMPIDYFEYRLDLDKWNSQPEKEDLEWDLAYVYSQEYNQKDASYESYENLQNLLLTDENILNKFSFNESSGYDKRHKVIGDKGYYCDTIANPDQQQKCAGAKKDIFDKLQDFARGNWREKINMN